MAARFPDVDWYCDGCDAHLNDQSGFDDDRSTWNCGQCGQENRIAADEIFDPYEFLANFDPERFRH